MPFVQWIMQNLQPMTTGVEVDGIALVNKLIQQVASGGATISGVSGSIVIKVNDGVIIDGFAPVDAEYSVTTTGGVELTGDAGLAFDVVLRELLPFTIDDIVYLEDGTRYIVRGFYYNLDSELIYEISDVNTTRWIPSSFLYRDNSVFLQNQLALVDQEIANLSA
jgi:hypothetical protein